MEDKKNKVLKKTPHTTSSKQYLHSTTNKVNNINFSNFETHQKKVSEHFLMHRKALFKKKEVHKAEEIMNHIPINGSSTTYK